MTNMCEYFHEVDIMQVYRQVANAFIPPVWQHYQLRNLTTVHIYTSQTTSWIYYLSICFLCPSTWLIRACFSDSLSCSIAICSKSCQRGTNILSALDHSRGKVNARPIEAFCRVCTVLTWIRNLSLWKLFFTSAFSSVSLFLGPLYSVMSWWSHQNKNKKETCTRAFVSVRWR